MTSEQHRQMTKSISTKGGSIVCLVTTLPNGVFVQLENATWSHATKPKTQRIRGGTLWVRNWDLAERTDDPDKLMCFGDLHELQRACIIIDARYAVSRPGRRSPKVGDIPRVNEAIQTGQGLARSALERRKLDPLERGAMDTILQSEADALRARRNEHMINVCMYYERALETLKADSLGRPNSSAAAMLTGSGIGELMLRREQIGFIDERIGVRRTSVEREIDGYMRIFFDLWDDVRESSDPKKIGRVTKLMTRIRRAQSEHAMPNVQRDGLRALDELKGVLATHVERLRTICAAPYRRNAYRTREDLKLAVTLCTNDRALELSKLLDKIKRGARWPFALKSLHDQMLTPLSVQLEFYRIRFRHKNRGIRKKFRVPFREYLVQFTDHFAWVAERFTDYKKRLERCDDEGFAHEVKKEVLAVFEGIQASIAENDWIGVKDKLQIVSRIL